MAEVLILLSHELRMLGDGANELQNIVGDLVASSKTGSASLYELQNLDKLSQSLAALAGFLEGVSSQAPSNWLIDAVTASQCVTLSDLSNRLNSGSQGPVEVETGVFEGFDDWAKTG